ncbi:OLC1v1011650C1 [Oldenlandia corymbosa var. corymbosa]|uniref:OLC1v1011650C1 n=1 Tax=Oldenlandia corymbosa var. corymbosa TaxID=529605 RepID=A0AAV1DUC1_OLDCO|nr:OLC1v1011650C1 [Oldenlandia corymbosa var. corymbosa]
MASHSMMKIMAKPEGTKLRIAMFPWLAFGHIIPFLEYAKFLAEKGHKITFISTTRNIDRLPKIPPSLAPSIEFVKLPMPRIEELPENAEATMDVHNDDIEYLKKAYDGLEPKLIGFLEKSPPDLIIYDFAPYWLPEKAAKLGISCVFFSIFNAWFFGFFGSTDMCLNGSDPRKTPEDFMVPAPWVPFENKVAYRRFEVDWMMATGKSNASGVSDILRAAIIMKNSDAVIIRHCLEFEGQWLKLLEDLHNTPVIPLGLMPPPPPAVTGGSDDNSETWVFIRSWLNVPESKSREAKKTGRTPVIRWLTR